MLLKNNINFIMRFFNTNCILVTLRGQYKYSDIYKSIRTGSLFLFIQKR